MSCVHLLLNSDHTAPTSALIEFCCKLIWKCFHVIFHAGEICFGTIRIEVLKQHIFGLYWQEISSYKAPSVRLEPIVIPYPFYYGTLSYVDVVLNKRQLICNRHSLRAS